MAARKIALVGSESVGKTTLGLILTGRLRTRGELAMLCAEPGAGLPFPPETFDTEPAAFHFAFANKMALEASMSLRPNVHVLVSDRTPLDFVAYAHAMLPSTPLLREMEAMARGWCASYDAVYFLPSEGTTYVEDGFREAAATNDYRDRVSAWMMEAVRSMPNGYEAQGTTLRERHEWVYHHVLWKFYGRTRPLRAYEQVKAWLVAEGWRVLEVRPQGSNSLTRFHPASDHDDIDAVVVVDGPPAYAMQVREAFHRTREQLENVVQANLDLMFVPSGMEPHEV